MPSLPTERRRLEIAGEMITKLGPARCLLGVQPTQPIFENTTGQPGVDLQRSGRYAGMYRARIRFCNALSGVDTRITLGMFDNAEDAGYAYRVAHVRLWGAISFFVGELTRDELEMMMEYDG